MILNDVHILQMMEQGLIQGASDLQVNPASLNITIGHDFMHIVDADKPIMLGEKVDYIPFHVASICHIAPHSFLLATTNETVKLPADICAVVKTRSSIGRTGLNIQNAGFVDPGFEGALTLELKNDTDRMIHIPVGYPVGQLIFFESYLAEQPYCGKYQHQGTVTGSRMELDKTGSFLFK